MKHEDWSFPRAEQLPTYAFVTTDAAKAEVRAAGADLIDLGMGNPDQPTPQAIVDQLSVALKDGKNHRYQPGRGLASLRQAIAAWYKRRYNVTFDPNRQAMVTMGAKDGMTGLCLAILGPGDSVLVPDPCYPIHQGAPMIAGAQVLTYPVLTKDPARAVADALARAKAQGHRVKLVIINYPHNPTGRTVTREELFELCQVVERSGAFLLHDMAYADLDFAARYAPSVFDCGYPADKIAGFAVEVFSMSKSYHMPGWRIAYMVGAERLIGALAHLKTYTDYGTFAPVQYAAAWALEHGDSIVDEVRTLYQGRAAVLVEELRQAGWDGVESPKSTMFVWAPLPRIYHGLSSLEATARLIREAHVALSPGSGFGPGGEGYVRFALIEDAPRIVEACQRIARLLQRAA